MTTKTISLRDSKNAYTQTCLRTFLEMAEHLLGDGYKDASAVIAGGVLEEHLRKLATKSSVPTVKPSGEPEKASSINAALAKQQVYNKTVEKDVTAWLGRRNDAAHGHYDKYVQEEVRLMIEGIRGFVSRHPA